MWWSKWKFSFRVCKNLVVAGKFFRNKLPYRAISAPKIKQELHAKKELEVSRLFWLVGCTLTKCQRIDTVSNVSNTREENFFNNLLWYFIDNSFYKTSLSRNVPATRGCCIRQGMLWEVQLFCEYIITLFLRPLYYQ